MHPTDPSPDGITQLPAEMRFDYAGRCWWCGAIADSREHKWKRSDIVRLYGTGPYQGELLWGNGDRHRMLQGASSSELKFRTGLCQPCNSSRSKPFDLAYDLWATYVTAGLPTLRKQRELDLSVVYGPGAAVHRANLARYFVKHVCCRLANDGAQVPADLIDFLDGRIDRPTRLRAGFGIRRDIEKVTFGRRRHVDSTPGLWMRPLLCWYSPSAGAISETWGGVALGYLEFWYWTKHLDVEPNFGYLLDTDRQLLLRYAHRGPLKEARRL